jgi:hypothetical protein
MASNELYGGDSMDVNVLRRLALIRYLYKSAWNQSIQAEPISALSILGFHDAVELFLHLVLEHTDGKGSRSIDFMQYWDILQSKVGTEGLSHKEAMRKLNNSRVAFKHYGSLPNRVDIETYRVNVRDFFEENTQVVFSLDFNDISLAEAVTCELCKTHLLKAKQVSEENIQDSLGQVAIAMWELLRDYEQRKANHFGRSPFQFGSFLPIPSASQLGISDHNMKRFVDGVQQSLDGIQTALRVISLGLDYKRFARFQMLTPRVFLSLSGERVINAPPKHATVEDYQFCFDFVIESALSLQEFDFSL